MIITGKYTDESNLNINTNFMIQNSITNKTNQLSKHIWVKNIEDYHIYNTIDIVRKSDDIINELRNNFPNCTIKNVPESDEIYFAVSPKDAKGSDRSLVDCHYDAPFSLFPNFNVLYYRVIVACNENNDVTTIFPNDDIKVKMTTGDFHGLDYNKDYHCVDGTIPLNKNRVLLKLHYLIIPENTSNMSISYVRFINTVWTTISRKFMTMSLQPSNPLEYLVGLFINICRYVFNNMFFIIFLIIITLLIKYFIKKNKYPVNNIYL